MSEVRRTTCNRDCPDACAMLVEVSDGRAVRLAGDPEDPVTRGFLCQRTNRFLTRQYARDRFTHPLVRRGGKLEPISWDAALDLAAEKLLRVRAESGPAAILHYRSGGSLGILKHLAEHLFEQFGPVTVKRGDICSGAGEAAQIRDFGISESHDVFDLENSAAIILWGKNPVTSSPHLIPLLVAARKRGVPIVGIDPVRTRAARLCDRFLCPRPGADFAVAMAMVRWLLDRDLTDPGAASYCNNLEAFVGVAQEHTVAEWAREADLAPAEVEDVAAIYGQRRPAAILVGWGMGRRRNGSATVRALDALGAVSGNLGVPGGGVSYYFGRRTAFDMSFRRGSVPPRTLSEACLGAELLAASDPPVRAIWVTAGNPVAMLPDAESLRAGFARAEFTVVVDTHPTDTTDLADLVLPTLTLLEDQDVLGAFGNHYLRVSEPAVSPPGEARHELAILQGLAARIGVADALSGSVDDWRRRLLADVEPHGVTLDRLRQGAIRNPLVGNVLFSDRKFRTPSGRVELLTERAAPAIVPTNRFPLLLLATSTPEAQSSQWSTTIPIGPPSVTVHPVAAAGLAHGAEAELESQIGRLRVTVQHDPTMRRDVALMQKGGMYRDGRSANLLVEAVETDDGGGAAYYDQPVRLVAPVAATASRP